MSEHHHHIAPVKYYVGTFGALLALTILTVAVAQFDFSEWNIIIAMIVAVSKASLVLMFFMGLLWDKKNQLNLFDLKIKKIDWGSLATYNFNLILQSSNEQKLAGFVNWFNDLKNRGNLNFTIFWSFDWKKMQAKFDNSDFVLEGKTWELSHVS